jgi:cytochrome c-type biogenesis protein CcmF
MAVGPVAKWRRDKLKELFSRLKIFAILAVVVGGVLPLAIYGNNTMMTAIGIAAAAWVMLSSIYAVVRLVAKRDAQTALLKAYAKVPKAMYGMLLAHFGMGIFIIGVVFTSSFSDQAEQAVKVGEKLTVAGYDFTLEGVAPAKGPNYDAMRGSVRVEKNEQLLTTLLPEKRIYNVQRNAMTEASIHTGVFADLYVALGEPITRDEWGLRVYYRPFIQWIWLGCLLMALGGIVGALDQRYRAQRKTKSVNA